MTQPTGTPIGDQPPGAETGSDADAPLDRPTAPDSDTDDGTNHTGDADPEHQQRDRYQPL